MSQFITGSLCLTDILAAAKDGHTAFYRGKNDKIYFYFQQWVNSEPDQYGNDSSILLNSKDQESREREGKIYIGNARVKKSATSTPQAIATELEEITNDLPF